MPNVDHSSGHAIGDETSAATPIGDSSAESANLGQDIPCPNCEYNLRGLGSDDVICPECGIVSNVAELLTRRWDKPWYRAPGYSRMSLPAAWLVCSALILLVVSIINAMSSGQFWGFLLAGWMLGTTGVWALLMVQVARKMGGMSGIGFAALSHVALAGYLAGVPLLLSGIVWLIWTVIELFDSSPRSQSTGLSAGLSIAIFLVGLALFALGRWIERVVAAYCIRLYLRGVIQ